MAFRHGGILPYVVRQLVRQRVLGAARPSLKRMLDDHSDQGAARELGFDLCGIARAESYPELAFLREWLDRGLRAARWLDAPLGRTSARTSGRSCRARAASSSPARSTTPARPYSDDLAPDVARISRYAWGDDYHDVLKRAARCAARVDARRVRPSRSTR